MKESVKYSVGIWAVAAAIAVAATGCATYKVVSRTGTPIERSRVDLIKPTETTRADIIKTFGEPADTSTEKTSSGEEIETLTYRFEEIKTPHFMGDFIESRKDSVVSRTSLVITIKDGLVHTYKYKSSKNKPLKE